MRTPRLALPLPEELRQRYQRNADLAGVSLTHFLTSWLESSAEGSDWLAEQVHMAKSAPAAVVRNMGKLASLAGVEPEVLLDGLQKLASADATPGAGHREAGAAAEALDPPSSNTGVNPSERTVDLTAKRGPRGLV